MQTPVKDTAAAAAADATTQQQQKQQQSSAFSVVIVPDCSRSVGCDTIIIDSKILRHILFSHRTHGQFYGCSNAGRDCCTVRVQ